MPALHDAVDLPEINPNPRKPKPPAEPGPGRPAGLVNRITRDLKHGIVDAAAAYGSDGNGTGGLSGYLFYLASEHPKAFASLLGKLLPLQVNANVSGTIAAVNIVSVPAERFVTQDAARGMPDIIDHEPIEPSAA